MRLLLAGLLCVLSLAVLPGPGPAAAAPDCRGARAFAVAGCDPLQRSGALTPSPSRAAADLPSVYDRGCIADPPAFRVVSCELGLRRGRLHLALLGNSLASQWADAVGRIGRDHGWRVTTYLASSCAPSDLTSRRSTGARCRAWGQAVRDRMIRQGVDVVLVTSSSGGYRDAEQAEQGYLDYLRPLTTAGVLVETLRVTPHPTVTLGSATPPKCLQAHPGAYLECSGPRSRWVEPDPVHAAGARLRRDRSGLLDLSDRLCTARTCVSAAGGVLAYRDGLHLTRTYVDTLRPYLDQRLLAAVRADR